MIPLNTSKMIMQLLRHPQKPGHNINQLAKELRISVGSSFKVLKELEKHEMVLLTRLSNASYYRLNLSNPQTEDICTFLLIEEKKGLKGYAKIYSDELQAYNKAEMIVLFGSVLKTKDFNDVDALFITTGAKGVSKFCLEISQVRSKPVIPLVMRKEELISEIKEGKEAIMDVVKKGIVLHGESVFVEVMRDAWQ